MNTRKIIRYLSKYFPKKYKESYDHVGVMVGKLKEDTKTIVLCLDFDKIAYSQIENNLDNIDLIITHHPFIFGTKMRVLNRDPLKKELYEKMEKAGVPIYSMHTNFDRGERGMNDAIAERLELIDIYSPEICPMMRVGTLKTEMEVHEFAQYVIDKFNLPFAELIAKGNKNINKVAMIGGGGSREWNLAKEEGADIYISGDIPHHARRDIVLNDYNYLNVYHEIEKIFMPQMKKLLLELDPSLNIIIIDHEEYPELIVNK